MNGAEVGAPLPPDVLARRETLPLKVAPAELIGSRIRLVPLDLERDAEDLFTISDGRPARLGARAVDAYDADALIWRYLAGGPFADAAALAAWLRLQVEAPDGLCLCVRDAATDRPVGVMNYMTNLPQHLKIELGNIWIGPVAQGTGAIHEASFLMLEHAFGLGYRRVEWKCDALNQRSRRTALRLGLTFEGIQEAHFIVKGRNRDTAWFRMLDHEWPAARAALLASLGRPH